MKRYQKLSALFLAVVMIFAFASCDSEKKSEETTVTEDTTAVVVKKLSDEEYQNIFKGAADIVESSLTTTGIDLSLQAKIKAIMNEDNQVSGKINLDLKTAVNDSVVSMLLTGDVDLFGTKESVSVYSDGTNVYTATGDEKYYTAIDEDNNPLALFNQSTGTEEGNPLNQIMSTLETEIAAMQVTEYDTVSDNVYTMTVTLGTEQLQQLMSKLDMPSLLGSMSGAEIDMSGIGEYVNSIGFNNLTCVATLDNNTKTYTVAVTCSLDITDPETPDANYTITGEADIVFSNIGSKVEITAPSDLDSYIEQVDVKEDLLYSCYELFDENFAPVENYEEIYNNLCEEYGTEAVNEALAEISSMVENYLEDFAA